MSDNTHEAHTNPIKTPKQLFWVSAVAFVLPILIIIGLVYSMTSSPQTASGDPEAERAIAERLQKVGTVSIGASSDANRPLASGEEVYKAQCAACHATGVSGSPILGDAAAWGPRLGQGYDTLLTHSLKGFNAMTPQGGGNFTDLEVGRAVVYMANAAGGNLPEPATPADAASAAAPAAEPAPAASAAEPAPAASEPPAAPAAEAPASAAAPAAVVAAAPAAAAAATTSDPAVGKALYEKACTMCHATGVAGAPKSGSKEEWAPRIAKGMDELYKSSLNGLNAMPPRGASTASDDEIKAAVDYMVNAAR
ncbi:MAG: c-type cytochrome [Pseudomonadota bacterium]|nr:c-type cytochrome [Pseudomonadota bacterium]